MNNSFKIKRVVGIGVLLALVVVLQLISNYIKFGGTVSITLALIPLTIGAILYGPLIGMILGFAMGVIVLVSPDTVVYLNFNIWLTIILCLVKSGGAGLISGLMFNCITAIKVNQKYKNAKFATAIVIAALITPIINTAIFILGVSLLFKGADLAGLVVSNDFATAFSSIYSVVITLNFLIEFLVSAVASPSLVYLIKILLRQSNLGFQNKFDLYIEDRQQDTTTDNIDSD